MLQHALLPSLYIQHINLLFLKCCFKKYVHTHICTTPFLSTHTYKFVVFFEKKINLGEARCCHEAREAMASESNTIYTCRHFFVCSAPRTNSLLTAQILAESEEETTLLHYKDNYLTACMRLIYGYLGATSLWTRLVFQFNRKVKKENKYSKKKTRRILHTLSRHFKKWATVCNDVRVHRTPSPICFCSTYSLCPEI